MILFFIIDFFIVDLYLFVQYMKTFFSMYKDEEFKEKIRNTKGFCLSHFRLLIEEADRALRGKELQDFYDLVLPLMEENMQTMYEDIAWFIEKYDYKNKDADWKNSKDALQRGMQKIKGQDPSLPPHKIKKSHSHNDCGICVSKYV